MVPIDITYQRCLTIPYNSDFQIFSTTLGSNDPLRDLRSSENTDIFIGIHINSKLQLGSSSENNFMTRGSP